MLCNICPRHCDVDRKTTLGFCGMPQELKVARAALHLWEEPCISGDKGSGTVFFSGCNMRCVFCQNKDISHGGFGKTVTVERLAEIFLELAKKGALNINLVTPTHFMLPIIQAVARAKQMGLTLP
ncbi:MAG: radical SAM protein, partial [Oscillospiraceae bacterium]